MGAFKKWLLLVDDEEDIIELSKNFLELNFGEKLSIISCKNGLEATNKLHFQAFDCIVTDLVMPKKEGIAFIESARQSHLNTHTPVIVVTGYVEKFPQNKFKHITLLEKPVETGKFVEIVGTQLKLGRTDKRIEADLLNAFITSTTKFIERLVKDSCEQMAPKPKKLGEPINDEVIRVFRLKSGKNKTTLVMGFNKKVLEELAKTVNRQRTDTFDYEHLAGAAGSIIIKRATQNIKSLSIVDASSYMAEKHREAYGLLTQEKGLTIPMRSRFGELDVHALW